MTRTRTVGKSSLTPFPGWTASIPPAIRSRTCAPMSICSVAAGGAPLLSVAAAIDEGWNLTAAMKDESTLVHCEHESERTFDEVVTAFEKAVGVVDGKAFQKAVAGSIDEKDFEARIRTFEGSSGFM